MPVLFLPRLCIADDHLGDMAPIACFYRHCQPGCPLACLDLVTVFPVPWRVLDGIQINEQVGRRDPMKIPQPWEVTRLTDGNDHPVFILLLEFAFMLWRKKGVFLPPSLILVGGIKILVVQQLAGLQRSSGRFPADVMPVFPDDPGSVRTCFFNEHGWSQRFSSINGPDAEKPFAIVHRFQQILI